jgi:hypothetical protein
LFKLMLTSPVAPVITGMAKHFMFQISWVSVLRLLLLLLLLLLLTCKVKVSRYRLAGGIAPTHSWYLH